MNRFNTFSAALVVCTVAFAPFAEAKKVHFDASGTTVGTPVDINGDGLTQAGTSSYQGTGTFGPYTATGVGEGTVWDGSSFCSSNEVKLVGGVGATVTRFANGDLLYARDNGDAVLCWDYTNYSFSQTGSSTVIGGTGAFAGATGNLTGRIKGQSLLQDASGVWILSAYSGVVEGDIQLAKPGS